jgi:glyoxylase-like metal-dependent hydrolase (beta-lactamase superfamily II)
MFHHSRALLASALLFIVAGFSPAALPAASSFSATKLADNIHLVTGPAGNTLVAVDNDGIVLIEGVPAEDADEYLAFVRQLAGTTTVKTLVITHWHDEVTGLNAALAGSSTEIIAHANTRQWLGSTIRRRGDEIRHLPLPKQQLPTLVFHDRLTLAFRGGSIELGYLLQAHTDGDIYAWFPQQNVLFTGPAVRSDRWPAVDEGSNGFIGRFVDSYETLSSVANDSTVIVPASGTVLSKADFEGQKLMYQNLMKQMVALLRQSRSAEEVVIANPTVGLRPEWGDAGEFLDEGFRSFYGHLRETQYVGIMP